MNIQPHTQSQAAIVNAIHAKGTIGIHNLSSHSAMHVEEILSICEQLERQGVLSIGSKGRKQTYTLIN